MSEGFYGVNCSTRCGSCEDNDVCDKSHGYCLRGCKQNYQPPYCKGMLSFFSIYDNIMWNFIHLFTGVESNVGPEDQMLPNFTVLYTLSSQKNVLLYSLWI